MMLTSASLALLAALYAAFVDGRAS